MQAYAHIEKTVSEILQVLFSKKSGIECKKVGEVASKGIYALSTLRILTGPLVPGREDAAQSLTFMKNAQERM